MAGVYGTPFLFLLYFYAVSGNNTDKDVRTFGLEDPAKPDLIEAVPLSSTIGWFSKRAPPASPAEPPAVSALLMMAFGINAGLRESR